MQIENLDGARNLTAEAQAAGAVLGQLAEQQQTWPEGSFLVPRTTAINGLAVAIPLSLFVWLLVGLIVWLLAR